MTTTTSTTTSTQPPYCTDADLLESRPNILSLGVSGWSTQRLKARKIINRDLERQWYRGAADLKGINWAYTRFAPTLMLNHEEQIKDLSVFKTLQLVYEYLGKEVADDVFMSLSNHYEKKYDKELDRVVNSGIDYDWDADNVIVSTETAYPTTPRRLERC